MNNDWVAQLLDDMGFIWPGEHLEQWLDGTLTGAPVARYQAAFSGNGREDWLKVDCIAGPNTRAALQEWSTHLAEYFRADEFWCRHCHRNGVGRDLVVALMQLRRSTRKPVQIQSGWRCAEHNKAVGGATDSMHLYGLAADITPAPPQTFVRGLRAFSGLGFNARGRTVRHVDVRHVLGSDRGSVAVPATWRY